MSASHRPRMALASRGAGHLPSFAFGHALSDADRDTGTCGYVSAFMDSLLFRAWWRLCSWASCPLPGNMLFQRRDLAAQL